MSQFLILMSLILSGCLTTRTQLKEEQVRRQLEKQLAVLQRSHADSGTKFYDLEDELRILGGRLEVVELQMAEVLGMDKGGVSLIDQLAQQRRIIQALMEEVMTLKGEEFEPLHWGGDQSDSNSEVPNGFDNEQFDDQMVDDGDEIEPMEIPPPGTGKIQEDFLGSSSETLSHLERAEYFFMEESWQEAILEYEAHRQSYPDNKDNADITLKMGLAFRNLGLRQEARAFFTEVISEYPGTSAAKRAEDYLRIR